MNRTQSSPSTKPPGLGLAGAEVPGVLCPQCEQYRFRFQLDQLLLQRQFVCEHCGLVLTIDWSNSQPLLQRLRELKSAKDRVDACRKVVR